MTTVLEEFRLQARFCADFNSVFVSELLTRQQVHDEVLSAHAVSVTEVRMSPDLRHATVFVKPLLGQDEEAYLVFDEEGYVVNAVGMREIDQRVFRVANVNGVAGSVAHILNHALMKGGMFMAVRGIQRLFERDTAGSGKGERISTASHHFIRWQQAAEDFG